jgi:hypothetical protein
MRKLTLMVPLIALMLVATAEAQGTLVVSQNKCDQSRQGEIRRLTDSLWIPIVQELVNEGKLIAAGSAYHSWGDEWNVIVWYTATTTPAFLAAFDDIVSRFSQRHPAVLTQIIEWCSEHKDSIYTAGKSTVAAAATAAPPPD